MRISTLMHLRPGDEELDVVYASVEGVNEKSFDECLAELVEKAATLGATAVIGLQLVQSQFQWNQRTSLVGTAVRSPSEAGADDETPDPGG
ncbi:MAG: heavy metal-binding domain-containing protein [Acidimicrobiales bacterium]